jgi:hypothetical protein
MLTDRLPLRPSDGVTYYGLAHRKGLCCTIIQDHYVTVTQWGGMEPSSGRGGELRTGVAEEASGVCDVPIPDGATRDAHQRRCGTVFIRGNVRITATWAVVFTLNAALAWILMEPVLLPPWAGQTMNYAALIGAAAFTSLVSPTRTPRPIDRTGESAEASPAA